VGGLVILAAATTAVFAQGATADSSRLLHAGQGFHLSVAGIIGSGEADLYVLSALDSNRAGALVDNFKSAAGEQRMH
jgi:hypothetical protein